MSTTRRGIGDHAMVHTMETVRIHQFKSRVSQLERDRLAVVLVMMDNPLCTAKEAIEAANRLFPLPKGNDDGDRD